MKKFGIFLASLLALGFTACDDTSDLGIAQKNPQEAIMEANGITLDFGSALKGETINLNDFIAKDIPVISLVSAENLPEGAEIQYVMQIADNEAFNNPREITVNPDNAVECQQWEDDFISMYGKAPYTKDNWVRFAVYVVMGSQKSRVGGEDLWFATKKLAVTPVDLKLPIESAYYFYAYNTTTGATYEPVKMSHSDAHQYDDPTFSCIFTVTSDEVEAGGLEWYVIPESAISTMTPDNFYGVADTGSASDRSGNLSKGGMFGIINIAGTQKIAVNMLDLTYEISNAFSYLYTPGADNGWTNSPDTQMLYSGDYKEYKGLRYIGGEFKFTAQYPDWAPLNWGLGDTDNSLAIDGANIGIPAEGAGLYFLSVNIPNLTFSTYNVYSIGMIGGFNGWGGDEFLTPSEDFKIWTGSLTVSENTDFKFRMNSDWTVNLGGDLDNLWFDGANIPIEAGSYDITLDITNIPYSCKIVKK